MRVPCDNGTGFHSNDIESEYGRLKKFVRTRYGQLKLEKHSTDTGGMNCGDLYEYTFYVNVARDV